MSLSVWPDGVAESLVDALATASTDAALLDAVGAAVRARALPQHVWGLWADRAGHHSPATVRAFLEPNWSDAHRLSRNAAFQVALDADPAILATLVDWALPFLAAASSDWRKERAAGALMALADEGRLTAALPQLPALAAIACEARGANGRTSAHPLTLRILAHIRDLPEPLLVQVARWARPRGQCWSEVLANPACTPAVYVELLGPHCDPELVPVIVGRAAARSDAAVRRALYAAEDRGVARLTRVTVALLGHTPPAEFSAYVRRVAKKYPGELAAIVAGASAAQRAALSAADAAELLRQPLSSSDRLRLIAVLPRAMAERHRAPEPAVDAPQDDRPPGGARPTDRPGPAAYRVARGRA